MLGRWEIDKGLRSQMEYEALDAILMNIVEYFMNNELQVMSLKEVKEQFFDSYLKVRNFDLNPDDLFGKAIARCGIISASADSSLFSFRHRTFAEFFSRAGRYVSTIGPPSRKTFLRRIGTTPCIFTLGF